MADTAFIETPEPLTDPDNVGPIYVDYRTQAADDALIGQARQRAQALVASQPGGKAEPQAAAPDGSAQPTLQAEAEEGAGGLERFGQSVVAGGEDLVNFVLKSPTEVPRAVWYGLQKAAAALLTLPLEAGAAIDQLQFEHGLISEETVKKHRRWIEAIKTAPDADTFLNVRPPETVTGNVISSAVQFISVATRAATAIKALGAAAPVANAAGGFISGTTAFQGSEDTLAEWIQSNPKYANVVTEFLASDPDDSEAEKRLKNGLEGLLGDALIGSFVRSLKFVKAGREAGMSKAQEGATPLPPQSELPELTPEHLQRLGDPDAPLVRVIDYVGQPYDIGHFADGQLRRHSDMKAFVETEVLPTAEGAKVANPTFDLGALGSDALERLIGFAPGFGSVPNRFFLSGSNIKTMNDAIPGLARKLDSTITQVLLEPDFVLPNPRFPADPWKRPLLTKQQADRAIVVVETRLNGKGIDVVGVQTRLTKKQLNKITDFAVEQGYSTEALAITKSTKNADSGGPLQKPQATVSSLNVDQANRSRLQQELSATYQQATAESPRSELNTVLGPATPEGVQLINSLLVEKGFQIDITGYSFEANAYAARHAVTRHTSVSVEAAQGQLPVTAEDWASIPDILAAPDETTFVGTTKRGAPVIAFSKEIDGNALRYTVEVLPGSKVLAATTMSKRSGRLRDIFDENKGVAEGVNAGKPAPTLNAQSGSATSNIGDYRADINGSKLETGDDIQSILTDLTDAFPDDVPLAKRGVASKEATQAVADALGMSVDDVLKQRNGADFTPEQVQAARRLLTASQEKLIEVARAAAGNGATAVDQYAFRRMLATHYGIQAEVLGAGSKTASALDTWRLPAGTGQEQMRALEQRLQASGGAEISQAMAWRLSALAQAGVDPNVMNQAIRRAASANSIDAVRQIYVDGLLSTPLPHVANGASGFFVAMQQIVERGVAGKIARATGSGGVAEGEATAMMYGLLSGQWDALRLASRTMMGKATQPTTAQLGKLEGPRFDLDQAGGPGRVVDYLGKALGVGPKVLDGTDAYFKSIGYRMELHAQAFRQARSEGLEGTALGERVAGLVADPPPNIRLAAADAALYNTFSNPNGAIGQTLLKMRNGGGALNPLPFIFPFVRAPINVTRYTFERTPLAPLVGQWRADIAAGGARRDLALARMAVGSTALAVATDLAMQGKVSGLGPKDPAERDRLMKTGWLPHAVNIGGTWHAYNPSDPLGQTLAFAADVTDALSGDVDPDHVAQWDEVTAGGIAALAQFAGSKAYLQGLADFAQAISDPQRFGGDYVARFAGAFLSADAGAPLAGTPLNDTPLGAMQAKVRALAGDLTPRRNLWGDPSGDESAAPIDQELLRLGTYPPSIQKKTSFQNVPVNFRDWPEVYDEYVRLAGNALKSPLYDGLGARDLLDQVVSGSNRWAEVYAKATDGPDGTKARFVQSIVRQFRTSAQDQIMNDPRFKDFAGTVRRMQAAQSAPLEKVR
jgi:hypothetical protein